MTNDPNLNYYLTQLQNIINELYSISEDIRINEQGLGQEKCANSLQSFANYYAFVKGNIIYNSYNDINNK